MLLTEEAFKFLVKNHNKKLSLFIKEGKINQNKGK